MKLCNSKKVVSGAKTVPEIIEWYLKIKYDYYIILLKMVNIYAIQFKQNNFINQAKVL